MESIISSCIMHFYRLVHAINATIVIGDTISSDSSRLVFLQEPQLSQFLRKKILHE
jgi:hypothetical protein